MATSAALRSKIFSSSSSSNFFTATDSVGCDTWQASAARPKCFFAGDGDDVFQFGEGHADPIQSDDAGRTGVSQRNQPAVESREPQPGDPCQVQQIGVRYLPVTYQRRVPKNRQLERPAIFNRRMLRALDQRLQKSGRRRRCDGVRSELRVGRKAYEPKLRHSTARPSPTLGRQKPVARQPHGACAGARRSPSSTLTSSSPALGPQIRSHLVVQATLDVFQGDDRRVPAGL